MRYMYSPTGRTFLVMLTEYGQAYRTYVAHVNRLFMAKAPASFIVSIRCMKLNTCVWVHMYANIITYGKKKKKSQIRY